jgi:hypothetical protein
MRKRKNFFITLVLILLFWTLQFFIIFFVEPKSIKDLLIPDAYLPFFINLFLALFLTSAVLFANSRRGLFISLGVITFLYLRLFGLGNILNLFLIVSIIFVLELYFKKQNKKK